jgi:hypothetical protein
MMNRNKFQVKTKKYEKPQNSNMKQIIELFIGLGYRTLLGKDH